MTAPVVRVAGLGHAFGEGDRRQQVLSDVRLDINPGELVILTGPSGCGKTTLLTLIGGLRSVQEGSVVVMGREMRGLDRKGLIAVRCDIGFIFQQHNLLEALTAAQNVTLTLRLKRYTAESLREHAERLLRVFQGDGGADVLAGVPLQKQAIGRALAGGLLRHLGLEDRVSHTPAQLSGGQKQRVAIARALVNYPRLILADEPTAALDRSASGVVMDVLKRLTATGTAVLLVTHDPRIMEYGDRVVALKDGRVESNTVVDETVRLGVFLQALPLFSGLSPGRLVEVAAKVRREAHPAGTPIIRQGEPGDKFYVLREGKVSVVVGDGAAPRVVATMGAGQFFGEAALLEDRPRNATVVADEPVELYTLTKEDFLNAYASFPSMRGELVKAHAQRSRPEETP